MLASARARLREAPRRVTPHAASALWSGSVAVPSDFLGLTFHRYPKSRDGAATVTPAPTFPFGTWRVHDYGPNYNYGVFWRALHPGSGDFTSGNAASSWADLDQAIDLHYAAGRNISYSIYGCPGWAAATPAQADPYGGTGGSSPPTSQASLSEFVTRLVTRYNTDSIRNNSGAKKLKYLEIWNEPTYTVSSTSFFIGTAADLAAMAKTVKTAAKAVDSTITILSPSFTSSPSAYITPFLNASDGAAGFGRDHVEGVAYHPYSTQLQGAPNMGGLGVAATVDADVRAAIAAGGLASNFPIYGMEQAISSSASSPLLSWPMYMQAAYVARITALYAALAWKKVTWYSHDNDLAGNPGANAGVSDALRWAAGLAGKTLTAIDLLNDGRMRVTHSGGELVY